MQIQEFKKRPILGIIRGVSEDIIKPLTEEILKTDLATVEITMNTPKAPALIKQMKQSSSDKLTVGAGTVLSVEEVKECVDNGASFIVSPVYIEEVVSFCVKHSIPVFPGAITPQEIFAAWNAGATMVKVFPVKFYGPDYIQEIKGPLDKIELLACGGVNPKNIQAYFEKGASAVAFGGSVFQKEWMTKEGLPNIKKSIDELMFSYRC